MESMTTVELTKDECQIIIDSLHQQWLILDQAIRELDRLGRDSPAIAILNNDKTEVAAIRHKLMGV